MNWYIPKEHGAWAMVMIPLLLGTFASIPNLFHLLFIIAVLSFYCGSGPIFAYIRRPKIGQSIIPALAIYSGVGIIFIGPVLLYFPRISWLLAIMVPLFLLNIYFAKQKKERLFINDAIGIGALSVLAMIMFYLGTGSELITVHSFTLALLNFFFFIASVFHIKTFIRERGNQTFLYIARGYHLALVVIPFFAGLFPIALIFSASALKNWVMLPSKVFKPMVLGIIEIVNSIIFLVLVIIVFS
ncbi:YwiC-like family protein [Bacillus alkalicellulosilyticus]|uniref:YwiC-like family protein n=1 Tax=Alkalihalobacterium alkalicellulosilyticum TaxID=1912214 RepID=UPI00148322CA|nr:YwiC-like family protein [Bacillus alkalicellulosilyticus]